MIFIFSNYPPPTHGVSLFNQLLVQELTQRGIPHRFFQIGTKGGLEQIETFSFGKVLADLATLARLAMAAVPARLQGQPVVVYFTPSQFGVTVIRDFLVATVGRLLAHRVIAHIHGCRWLDSWKKGGWQARFMEKALARCSKVICLGTRYASNLEQETGFPSVGINNGIPDRGTPPSKVPLDAGPPISVLFLSNFMKAKGLWVAARAIQKLAQQGFPIILRCAGHWMRPEEKAEFEAEFRGELDSGVIRMLGFADAPTKARLLEEAHFLFLPILNPFEGQPLTLIEAMSAGTVPVTTRYGGIPDLFAFEGGEKLSREEHVAPEGIAQLLTEFALDPDAYLRLSEKCRTHFEKELTFSRCGSQVIDVLSAEK